MDIDKISNLAKLRLSEEEKTLFSQQLEVIVDSFADIASISTDHLKPFVMNPGEEHHCREDQVVSGWSSENESLVNAKQKVGKLFRAPASRG